MLDGISLVDELLVEELTLETLLLAEELIAGVVGSGLGAGADDDAGVDDEAIGIVELDEVETKSPVS